MANLGDSRAVACIHGAARPLTQVHNVDGDDVDGDDGGGDVDDCGDDGAGKDLYYHHHWEVCRGDIFSFLVFLMLQSD